MLLLLLLLLAIYNSIIVIVVVVVVVVVGTTATTATPSGPINEAPIDTAHFTTTKIPSLIRRDRDTIEAKFRFRSCRDVAQRCFAMAAAAPAGMWWNTQRSIIELE
jgi:hypothetical protein